MVDMDVRTHDGIDVFGLETGGGEAAEEIGLQMREDRQIGTILVIAGAGIEQDALIAGIEHPALQARYQLARGRIEILGDEFTLAPVPIVRLEPLEQFARRAEGAAPFFDPVDRNLADLKAVHRVCPNRQKLKLSVAP